jgi:hypothetical protein
VFRVPGINFRVPVNNFRVDVSDQYAIATAEAVRYSDIHRAILEYEPHIIHFSGHGTGEEGLVFEDESGQIKLVDAEALAGLFQLFADQVQRFRKFLEEAEAWARDKSLSYQDRQFLAASKEQEIQEEIAAKEQEAALERERKDREAAENRNKLLSEANEKAKQQIRNGTIILILTVLVAAISVILAGKEVKEAQQKLKETYTYVAYLQQLRELVSKLPPNSEAAQLISKQADIKIKDAQIEQVYLHAAKALAYQNLKDWKSAEESIKQSMNFLRGWKENQKERGGRGSNSEFLEAKIFALNVQGKLLSEQGNNQKAIEAYKEAFSIIQKNPNLIYLQSTLPKIIDSEVIESVSRSLIELLSKNNTELELRKQVEQSLTQHLYAQLEDYLKAKNWQAADRQTDQLMLNIAKREELP